MSDNDHLNESLRTIAKGAGIGFAGAMFGTAVGYLSRMVIARYLGPDDYGLISLGFAAMMIATVLSLMGLNFVGICIAQDCWVQEARMNAEDGVKEGSATVCIVGLGYVGLPFVRLYGELAVSR